jgi:2-polyprenyl-6-methoxyphenol hydroxylase-like FAD-dependent oxidoreductase
MPETMPVTHDSSTSDEISDGISDALHDVIVVGAGPNGLMLTCELALAGVHPLVLEKLAAPTTETRANGMVGQVVRLLDRRGLLHRLTGVDAAPEPTPGFVFGGYQLPLADLPDNPLTILPVPQPKVEAMLAARAAELGVEVRRGLELTRLEQDAHGVTATVAGPDGELRLRARYLVGADGGRSATRKLARIDFPGVTNERTVSRTVSCSIPAELIDPATGGLLVPGYDPIPPFLHYRTERGLFIWAPFPGRTMITTLEWPDDPDVEDGEASSEELHDSVRRVLGVDVPFGPPAGDGPHLRRRLRASNSRLADRYRQGRVFLVGDAAHVHSAIGGPGLNLGMQDAANLAWKLAGALAGWAPDGLLDTYEAERRPAAQRVTMSTQAQGALISPGPEVTALRALFGELLADPGTRRRIAELMAGTDFRYQEPDGSGLVGRFAPDLAVRLDGRATRLAELTRSGRALLLDLSGGEDLIAEAAPWKDRVEVIVASGPDAGVPALLLRPDGYVAWAGGPGLREALTRWFGPS